MKHSLFSRLSVKLILTISAILFISLGTYTYITISKLNEDLNEAGFQNAYNLSDIIRKSTRYSMLLNFRDGLFNTIKTIGTEKGVEKICIYNKQGVIKFSSDEDEINKTASLKDAVCLPCHSIDEVPSALPQQSMMKKYINEEGKGIISLINPIRNEEDCSTADCHVHHSDTELLGILHINISTETTDEIVAANTRNIIISTALVTVLIGSFVILFIGFVVNRPLKEISKGIEEIGGGNLEYKINLRSNDELGLMADEFNQMSKELKKAYNEIKDWSENLNRKVEQKNEELKKIYEQITQVEKLTSLGKLSATVAHELNNPLEGILTYSKLISKKLDKKNDGGDYSDIQKFLKLIADESARCGKICKDLLLFSHRDEGHFSQCNLTEIIEKSLSLINHHFEINKINIIRNYSDQDLILNCDSQKIEQALIAVLMNAAEVMPNGGNLTLTLAKELNNATLRITDEGSGINVNDLPLIFEPFYTTKTNSKGTGLGLSVAYGILKQHDGKIFVEHTSIKGTTFKITLPLKQSEENNDGK